MRLQFCHRSWKRIVPVFAAAFVWVAWAASRSRAENLIVHEWGTFTVLQDDQGAALPGINIDDEPLPDFVYDLHPWILDRVKGYGPIYSKGAPERHPYVTLRLETPVIYFYPPRGVKLPLSLNVEVDFHGGWLTQFYPHATVDAPGVSKDAEDFGPIRANTVGKLAWYNVQVGTEGRGPETDSPVWLAPRKVHAAAISIAADRADDSATARSNTGSAPRTTESERYLFYRGVGNRPVPLRISQNLARQELTIRPQGDAADAAAAGQIRAAWLVDIRPDGTVAYRSLPDLTLKATDRSVLVTASSRFQAADYASDNLPEVREKMYYELVQAGLFGDEATAMLNTWQRAYFKSPGLRVFFIVPRAWTEAVLPLRVSATAEITRVMMGRIELISAQQHELLKKLSRTPVSDPEWLHQLIASPVGQAFLLGHSDFGKLNFQFPADYQLYLDLGRFRNALVLAEAKARPTPELNKFIATYGLYPYRVSAER
ncbi:MAG TPA: hypothetical protein VFE24_05495 [Pirellulales bacterium]|jgi:hypothetical protein|nr:hypothetical protein [Pirellulales bacterium]